MTIFSKIVKSGNGRIIVKLGRERSHLLLNSMLVVQDYTGCPRLFFKVRFCLLDFKKKKIPRDGVSFKSLFNFHPTFVGEAQMLAVGYGQGRPEISGTSVLVTGPEKN